MANKPIPNPLAADLPENWVTGNIVAPTGEEVGLSKQYGYNYLMEKVNEAIEALNTINDAFPGIVANDVLKQYLKLSGGTMTGAIAMSGQKITDLGDATDDTDALNLQSMKKYMSKLGYPSTFQYLIQGGI